jgi:hypothetical protein
VCVCVCVCVCISVSLSLFLSLSMSLSISLCLSVSLFSGNLVTLVVCSEFRSCLVQWNRLPKALPPHWSLCFWPPRKAVGVSPPSDTLSLSLSLSGVFLCRLRKCTSTAPTHSNVFASHWDHTHSSCTCACLFVCFFVCLFFG